MKVYWFSALHPVTHTLGIVKCKDEVTEEIKYYIGAGMGFNEQDDIDNIVSWGAKIPRSQLEDMLDEKEY